MDPIWSAHTDTIRKFDAQSDMAAVEWVLSMREGMQALRKFDDSVYMLRYEDLAANPETALTGLLKFCEMKPDAKLIDYARRTLRPPRRNPALQVNELIHEQYVTTMAALNY